MDSLLKGFALVQTLWFAAQCVTRSLQWLETSTFEVMTIAYIVSMLPWGLLWWSKPYDVQLPTLLEPHMWPEGTRERLKELSNETGFVMFRKFDLIEFQRMRNSIAIDEFWTAKNWRQTPNCHALLLSASTLAAIHCTEWNSSFPTIIECWLWRASSLMILLIPTLGWWSYWIRQRDFDGRRRIHEFFLFLGNQLYLALRLILIIEVFLEFRAMPAGVYRSVDWTLYILSV
jgi:hypothetical protein